MDDEIRQWAERSLDAAAGPFTPKLAPYQREVLERLARGEKIEFDFGKAAFTQARAWKTHLGKLMMMQAAREGMKVVQARLEEGRVVLDEITSGMPYEEL